MRVLKAFTVVLLAAASAFAAELVLQPGAEGKDAVDTGYRRASLTIFDSNITTVIGAVFLYLFGTGPVRGFAVTLTVSVAASMFTAVVTKAVFYYFTGRRLTNPCFPLDSRGFY